jgi:hypothetical protein
MKTSIKNSLIIGGTCLAFAATSAWAQTSTTTTVQQPDGDVVWQEAPNYPKYHWARLNGQWVVVETDSHKVVAVY